MFGYVRIHRPALSDADYELYRGVYCSLCGALGRRYGPAARLTLRYDMTFLALLALSRAPESPEFQEGRCAYQPWKRCRRCTFPISARGALERAADIAMCMVCHKWRDSLSDERWYRKLWLALAAPLFLLWHKKAKRLAPEADRQVKIAMAAQRLVEAGEAPGLDACAHPSAHALGTLCAMAAEERELHSRLYRLGYLLG
ncbi:MAG: DUF5685 family protein, partial [Oscillospiraceae bacterium]|nr:DUF5685 family protein [Oscillospiraceae bacterium]